MMSRLCRAIPSAILLLALAVPAMAESAPAAASDPLDQPITVKLIDNDITAAAELLTRKTSVKVTVDLPANTRPPAVNSDAKNVPLRQVLDDMAKTSGMVWTKNADGSVTFSMPKH